MHSAVAGIVVALVMGVVAHYKGRTGWHWFTLSLVAFAVIFLVSAGALYLANVPVTWARADTLFAGGVGALTAAVMLVVVLCVPSRPRRYAVPSEPGRRQTRP